MLGTELKVPKVPYNATIFVTLSRLCRCSKGIVDKQGLEVAAMRPAKHAKPY